MLPNITVYTSITGHKDTLLEGQAKGASKYIAYTYQTSDQWTVKAPYTKFKDDRRNSRIQKILSHQYIDTEYSIYIDGNIQLIAPPEEIIKKYLGEYDIAVYRHPTRDCIYNEATTCAVRKLDDPETIIEQAKTYEDSGYAKNKGMAECGIIIRRNTKKLREFENAWWSEYCRHSRRDQISFMYAADRVGIKVNLVPDFFIEITQNMAMKQSGDFKIITHKIPTDENENTY